MLTSNNVTEHIYISYSSNSCFNIFLEVADPDAEEGEILEEEDKIRYDLSKLIQFPGFNAPMPEDAVDVRNVFMFSIVDSHVTKLGS